MEINLQDRIDLFKELVTCSHNILYWCYDSELTLIDSDTPETNVYDALFKISGCKDYLLSQLNNKVSSVVLSDSIGFMWIATPETKNSQLKGCM